MNAMNCTVACPRSGCDNGQLIVHTVSLKNGEWQESTSSVEACPTCKGQGTITQCTQQDLGQELKS